MTGLANHTLRCNRLKDQSKGAIIADIVEQFNCIINALGSKIRAAYASNQFVRFLTKEKKIELEQFKKMEDVDASSDCACVEIFQLYVHVFLLS